MSDINPPVEHLIGNAKDFLYPDLGFYAGTFTASNFNNGDDLSQELFGPARIWKDRWTAHLAGIVTIPVSASAWGFKLLELPDAYLPPVRRGAQRTVTTSIWAATTHGTATITIFANGDVNVDSGIILANATFVVLDADWPTRTFDE